MSRSAIYANYDTVGTAVAVGGALPFDATLRRFGCSIDRSGNTIILKERGYYAVDVVATVTAVAVGNISITLFQDGTAVDGATAFATAAAIGDEVELTLSAIVRNMDCTTDSLTVVVGDNAITTDNNSIRVIKL